MKKVMTILTAAAFVLGAAGMVSFTVKQQNDAENTAWFYVDEEGNPDLTEGPKSLSEIGCEENYEQVCAREFNLSPAPPHNPTTPTGTSDIMGEKQ